MNSNKTTNILQLLLLLFVFISCNKEKKNEAILINDLELHKDSLPKMQPLLDEEPKLTTEYINLKKNKIEAFYNNNWPNNSLNGGILVAKNGQIIYEKYAGFSNFKNKTLMNSTTPLHIASVGKVITATAVLKLVNANRIKLDDKVTAYLENFPYPEVTVRMLLNHRSGMRNYAYFTDKDKNIWDRKKTLTNQDILNIMATKNIGLEKKTDTGFSYCNSNYAILALIVEKVTQLSFREALQKMIFEPLNMKHSFVLDFDNEKHKVAPSYRGNKTEIGIDYLDKIYGDKNIYSTPRDLLKFERARNSPSFLNPKLLSEVYIGYSNEHPGTKNYGLGIRILNWKNGKNFYFHNGWWHGFTSSFISLMDENVTIISLSNKFTRKTYSVRKISNFFGDYPFNPEDE